MISTASGSASAAVWKASCAPCRAGRACSSASATELLRTNATFTCSTGEGEGLAETVARDAEGDGPGAGSDAVHAAASSAIVRSVRTQVFTGAPVRPAGSLARGRGIGRGASTRGDVRRGGLAGGGAPRRLRPGRGMELADMMASKAIAREPCGFGIPPPALRRRGVRGSGPPPRSARSPNEEMSTVRASPSTISSARSFHHGRVLEPVSAEAVRQVEALDARRRPDDRGHPGSSRRAPPTSSMLAPSGEHADGRRQQLLGDERLVGCRLERRPLVRAPHPHQDSPRPPGGRERGDRVDHQGAARGRRRRRR